MSRFQKFWKHYGDNFKAVFLITVSTILAGLILYLITAPNLREGMVMNKYFLEGYEKCFEKGKCAVEHDRWIVVVQNGEKKDWWQVSQSYFDEVELGDWVKK